MCTEKDLMDYDRVVAENRKALDALRDSLMSKFQEFDELEIEEVLKMENAQFKSFVNTER